MINKAVSTTTHCERLHSQEALTTQTPVPVGFFDLAGTLDSQTEYRQVLEYQFAEFGKDTVHKPLNPCSGGGLTP